MRVRYVLMMGGLVACTVLTPPATPTIQPGPTATESATAVPTMTATLRPTATSQATFTPVGGGIATPIPIQQGEVERQQASPTNSSGGGGMAPVGVREAPDSTAASPPRGGSGSFSVPAQSSSPLTPTVPPTFVDEFTYTVPAGRTLVIDYDVTVPSGTVVLWAATPDGLVLWQQGFTETTQGEAEIDVPEAGDYTIFIFAERLYADLDYDISYRIR